MLHKHEYQTIHASVVAEYHEENFFAIGEFKKCECGDGLFIPTRKDLAPVQCEELQRSEH